MIIEHHGGCWGIKHLRDMGIAATVAEKRIQASKSGCQRSILFETHWKLDTFQEMTHVFNKKAQIVELKQVRY